MNRPASLIAFLLLLHLPSDEPTPFPDYMHLSSDESNPVPDNLHLPSDEPTPSLITFSAAAALPLLLQYRSVGACAPHACACMSAVARFQGAHVVCVMDAVLSPGHAEGNVLVIETTAIAVLNSISRRVCSPVRC